MREMSKVVLCFLRWSHGGRRRQGVMDVKPPRFPVPPGGLWLLGYWVRVLVALAGYLIAVAILSPSARLRGLSPSPKPGPPPVGFPKMRSQKAGQTWPWLGIPAWAPSLGAQLGSQNPQVWHELHIEERGQEAESEANAVLPLSDTCETQSSWKKKMAALLDARRPGGSLMEQWAAEGRIPGDTRSYGSAGLPKYFEVFPGPPGTVRPFWFVDVRPFADRARPCVVNGSRISQFRGRREREVAAAALTFGGRRPWPGLVGASPAP